VIGRNRVVITGLGVLAANGIGKEAFWNSLLTGKSGIGPITLFDPIDIPCKIAGEVKNFNPLDYMDASLKPRRMGRFSQLGIAGSLLALRDAGLELEYLRSLEHFEIVLGVATSDIDLVVEPPRIYSTPSLVPHAAATAISKVFGVKCTITTLSNACTSGMDSIAKAAELIRAGKADLILAGSAEASITYTTLMSLWKGGMLPEDMNDTPEIASSPFSNRRRGGILSEGSGIVVLESLDQALARGAIIYAEVLGHGNWIHPNQREDGFALVYAMQSAIDNSGIAKSDVDYINAHAPSDPVLDRAESNSIKHVFSKRAYDIPISSIKAVTGNPFACGGSLQVIATALAMQSGILPPTANYNLSDPDCDLDYIPNTPRRASIGHAMINSRGIGGGNSSMILRNWTGML